MAAIKDARAAICALLFAFPAASSISALHKQIIAEITRKIEDGKNSIPTDTMVNMAKQSEMRAETTKISLFVFSTPINPRRGMNARTANAGAMMRSAINKDANNDARKDIHASHNAFFWLLFIFIIILNE